MTALSCLRLTALSLTLALAVPAAHAAPDARETQYSPQPAAERITHEQLVERLDALGFAPPRTVESLQGTPVCCIEFTENDFHFVIYVGLSPDGSRVFFNAPLRELPEMDGRYAPALMRLLEKNHEISPLNFNYNAETGYLYLTYGDENEYMTSRRLRQMMVAMMDVLRETQSLWDPSQWAEASETAVQTTSLDADDQLERMQGTWRVVAFESNGLPATPEQIRGLPELVISGDSLQFGSEGSESQVFQIESIESTTPYPAFDLRSSAGCERAIYSLNGNRLTIALAPVGAERPFEFASNTDGTVVFTLERIKGPAA